MLLFSTLLVLAILVVPRIVVVSADSLPSEAEKTFLETEPKIHREEPKQEIVATSPLDREIVVESKKDIEPQITPKTPQRNEMVAMIESSAEHFSVPKKLAVELANFESGLSPTAASKESSAKGMYQFVSGTWESLCKGEVTDAQANTNCAMKLLRERAISHWTADIHTRKLLVNLGYVICTDFQNNICNANY